MTLFNKRNIVRVIRYLKREREINAKRIERFILIVIFINAVVMGLETSDYMQQNYGTILKVIDRIALYIFTFEILTKLLVTRWRFFKNSWNIFDFIIIGISWIPDGGSASMLRSLRILRVFLFISFMPKLRFIVQTLLQSLPAIFGISLLLLIIFYVFGVMTTISFKTVDPDHFGTLGQSLFTLFRLMTLDNWVTTIADTIRTDLYALIFFVPFILFSSYIILNIFIAIIINGMREARLKNEEKMRQLERQEEKKEFQDRSEVALHILVDKLDKMNTTLSALQTEVRELKAEREKDKIK